MKIPKPTDEDKAYFLSIAPDDDLRVEVKPMFGNLAAFVNGNMFMGLFGPAVGVRLDDADRDELRAVEGAGPFSPEDLPMKEYVALPTGWRDDAAATADWVGRTLEHAGPMPLRKK